LLACHQVVGWFHGAAEIGPRALDARSLLGNPSDRANLVRTNQLKGHELWRPLAPSVTIEAFSRYFTGPDRSQRQPGHHQPALLGSCCARLSGAPAISSRSTRRTSWPASRSSTLPTEAIRGYLKTPVAGVPRLVGT
jgi:hypothetical protein